MCSAVHGPPVVWDAGHGHRPGQPAAAAARYRV